MDELQKALDSIAYENRKFPEAALTTIAASKEAIPCLHQAIEKALEEKEEIEDGYQLHFYALFLLGELQDRGFFPTIVEFVSLPENSLDFLIGDLVTSGLADILYNTYNGNLQLLKETAMNEGICEFVRADVLEVMAQLYLDGTLEKEELKAFIRQNVYGGAKYSYFYDAMAQVICECHFVDMLPEIKYMLDHELMEEMTLGKYDACVDYMFEYRKTDEVFCKSPIRAVDMLRGWAMFKDESPRIDDETVRKNFEKVMREMRSKKEVVRKIGRNDPCPCGSGKKYKQCCLNKPKSPLESIESEQERNKCLEDYPYIGNDRQENRVYLDDYYDPESIEIDKVLYLGMRHRPGFVWDRNPDQEEDRCRKYLTLAFQMFVDKVERDGIQTFEQYDRKCSIHYFCEEWIETLLTLADKSGDRSLCKKVQETKKMMDHICSK